MHTIRAKLIVIFIVCLSFTGGLAGFYYYNIFVLEEKLILIERFDDFKDNILELRRYEKNFFLTHKDVHLEQIDHYLSITEKSFLKLEKKMIRIMDSDSIQNCAMALKKYRSIISKKTDSIGQGTLNARDIRDNGTILTKFSEQLIQKKRRRVKRVLNQMMLVPLGFGAGFIFLVIFVMHLTWEDILKPLALMQEAAERVGKGIFKTLDYDPNKKDEVAHCLSAFNRMVVEIDAGQDQLCQSRKMASIGTFTSGIAHELNNPINNISLIVDSLLEDYDTMEKNECRGLYNDLMVQADRATDIVKNLLEFSRTDQDHFENISIEQMVEKTQRLLKNELNIKGIKFQSQIEQNLPNLLIDQSKLQQALINLILNGIHAMPDGGELTLKIEQDIDSNNIRIDIKDTGIGIPKDQLTSIFDPFFTTKKEGEGTGLGLSVTYNIIQRHNGRISVTSTPGKGTCFSIFLPVKNMHGE